MDREDELAAEYLRVFPSLNPELAKKLAQIADSFYWYKSARVHSE